MKQHCFNSIITSQCKTNTLKRLGIGTHKTINLPFDPNGKLMI